MIEKAHCTFDGTTGLTGTDARYLTGSVNLHQQRGGVSVKVRVSGFRTSDAGPHGFHVHWGSSTDDQCGAAGRHYNPSGASHGGAGNTR